MTAYKLIIIITVTLVVEVISSSWFAGGVSSCKTSDDKGGDCKPLRHCRPLKNLIEPYFRKGFNLKTLPEYISERLKKYECDTSRNEYRVCCPRTRVAITDPIRLLPLDLCGKFESGNKIANGAVAELFSFPWMAQLYKKGNNNSFCGGTMINNKYVLTAAHCIKKNDKPSSIIVRLGEYNTTSPKDCDNYPDESERSCAAEPQNIEVEVIERHKLYDVDDLTNDIALLRLKTPAKITDRVKPICLPVEPSNRNKNFSSVVVTGWGITEKTNPSEVLLYGRIGIVKPDCCRMLIPTIQFGESQICLGDAECDGGKVLPRNARNIELAQTCKGDSGGPIQQIEAIEKSSKLFQEKQPRYFQYGVISQASECTQNGAGIHTRLDNYITWILDHIKE